MASATKTNKTASVGKGKPSTAAKRGRQTIRLPSRKEKSGIADELISRTPSSKSAQIQIAAYVQLTLKGQAFEILHRKKPVAVLAPPGQLPEGMTVRQHVTTTEIARGKRTFANVIHHGPYLITRDGREVAVAYAPRPPEGPQLRDIVGLLDTVWDKLNDLGVMDDARKRRLELRVKADNRIRARIEMLRRNGDNAGADMIAAELAEVEREEAAELR